MKILHTAQAYAPSIGGSQQVVKQISQNLANLGHEVTVVTSKSAKRAWTTHNQVRIKEFEISGSEVKGYRGNTSEYQQFLLDSQFDIIMNYAAQQWASDLAFPILGKIRSQKVFFPLGFSGLYSPNYAEYYKRMPEIMGRYDHLVFKSDKYRDINFAREHKFRNISVIPNGASHREFGRNDIDFRNKYNIPKESAMLLTVGSHTGYKGHSLALEAFRRAEIGPATFVLIGDAKRKVKGCLLDCYRKSWQANNHSSTQKRVVLLNPPRTDVVAAFHAADLFVLGSNVECSPIVLFEAMASGTPFLTTACGNAKEIVSWGHSGVVIPTFEKRGGLVDADPSVLARAIEDLMGKPDKLQEMADAGHSAWLERFTWEKISLEFEELYQTLLS